MFKFITFLTLILSIYSYAGEKIEERGVESLTPELRILLTQEMGAIKKGMEDIISNFISGDFEKVEKTANNIKDSFILKKKLTPSQKKELGTKLPASFVEMDRGFHKDAGMLAEAAKNRNTEVASFYFAKMTNDCMNCHSKFAKSRFPFFKNISKSDIITR